MARNLALIQPIIDHAYARFVADLPRDLQLVGEQLPHRLNLASHPDTPWSAVFNNPIVLAMPQLLALGERLPLPAAVRAAATEAHLFAIVTAFALDRVDDGQVLADPRLLAVIAHLRRARDRAFLRVLARASAGTRDYAWAEATTRVAQEREQRVLHDGRPGTLAAYLEVSSHKQALAFPAALAAAAAAGWPRPDRDHLDALIAGAALGLQHRDDVVDWIDDHNRGGSWLTHLLVERSGPLPPGLPCDELGERLHRAGILPDLLHRASEAFARAAAAARVLTIPDLAAWAQEQADLTTVLAADEARAPGHAVAWEIARKQRREARLRARQAS